MSILLISVDCGKISAFFPSEEPILTNVGNFLYPNPPNVFWILSTPPLAVFDLVEYLRTSVFDGTQVSDSGTFGKDIVKKLRPSATLQINEETKLLEEQGKKTYKFGFGQSPFPVPEVLRNEL